VLAHAGLTDLAWLGDRAADFPNLFFDTSWWSATDLLTTFAKVPPGQVLLGSDVPYSTPVWTNTVSANVFALLPPTGRATIPDTFGRLCCAPQGYPVGASSSRRVP
jgi:hypothetical protein